MGHGSIWPGWRGQLERQPRAGCPCGGPAERHGSRGPTRRPQAFDEESMVPLLSAGTRRGQAEDGQHGSAQRVTQGDRQIERGVVPASLAVLHPVNNAATPCARSACYGHAHLAMRCPQVGHRCHDVGPQDPRKVSKSGAAVLKCCTSPARSTIFKEPSSSSNTGRPAHLRDCGPISGAQALRNRPSDSYSAAAREIRGVGKPMATLFENLTPASRLR
jgi:hypothetical protein